MTSECDEANEADFLRLTVAALCSTWAIKLDWEFEKMLQTINTPLPSAGVAGVAGATCPSSQWNIHNMRLSIAVSECQRCHNSQSLWISADPSRMLGERVGETETATGGPVGQCPFWRFLALGKGLLAGIRWLGIFFLERSESHVRDAAFCTRSPVGQSLPGCLGAARVYVWIVYTFFCAPQCQWTRFPGTIQEAYIKIPHQTTSSTAQSGGGSFKRGNL